VSYSQVAASGWQVYAMGATIPLLALELGVSRAVAALHGTVPAVAGVIVGAFSGRLLAGWARGAILRLASALVATGVLLYGTGGRLALTLVGAFILGLGGSLLVAGVSAHLMWRHGPAGPTAIAEANAVGAVVGALGPVAVASALALSWGWRPGLLAVVPILVLIELARGGDLAPYGPSAYSRDDGGHRSTSSSGSARSRRPYVASVLALGFLLSVEFTLTTWGVSIAAAAAGTGIAQAAVAAPCIVGGLALGRVITAWLVRRRKPSVLLTCGAILSGTCAVLATFQTGTALCIVLLTVAGFGAGFFFPLGTSRAVQARSSSPDGAAAGTLFAVSAAGGLAPLAVGYSADQWGMLLAGGVAFAVFTTLGVLSLVASGLPRSRAAGGRP
jgi:MFS family permease